MLLKRNLLLKLIIFVIIIYFTRSKILNSHSEGPEFNHSSVLCANLSAHRLKPLSLPKIKLWEYPWVSEPMLCCRCPMSTITVMITILLEVTESTIWVLPHQKRILCHYIGGQRQERSTQRYYTYNKHFNSAISCILK
jgi:hypothetical protein